MYVTSFKLCRLVVTSEGTGSFQTVNFDLLSQKQFDLISRTLNVDSVAPKVSFEPSFLC